MGARAAAGRTRAPRARAVREPAGRVLGLGVEVVWGDITRVESDVCAVGHYQGLEPQNAELAIDRYLVTGPPGPGLERGDDRLVLTRLTHRGVLRGGLGQIAFFPSARARRSGERAHVGHELVEARLRDLGVGRLVAVAHAAEAAALVGCGRAELGRERHAHEVLELGRLALPAEAADFLAPVHAHATRDAAHAVLVTFHGYQVPAVQSSVLTSQIGEQLSDGYPFCIIWHDRNGRRYCSFRSREDGVDVGSLAASLGGGGHTHAAGFSVPLGPDGMPPPEVNFVGPSAGLPGHEPGSKDSSALQSASAVPRST